MSNETTKLYLKVNCTVCGNTGCYCPYCQLGKEYVEASDGQIIKALNSKPKSELESIIKLLK